MCSGGENGNKGEGSTGGKGTGEDLVERPLLRVPVISAAEAEGCPD